MKEGRGKKEKETRGKGGIVDTSVGVKSSITRPRALCLATDKHAKHTPSFYVSSTRGIICDVHRKRHGER